MTARWVHTLPRPSDHAQTGPHPPDTDLHGPLAELVDLDAWLDNMAIPNTVAVVQRPKTPRVPGIETPGQS